MHPYAQIDSAGICIAESQLSAAVEADHMIPIAAADGSYLGKRWQGGAWQAPAAPQRPRIVITSITADPPHDELLMVAADLREATLPVGATLVVDAELRAGGALLPLTDSFRLPLVSTDGRERVLLARMQDGRVTLRVPMTDSRIWRITETQINSALPEAAQMGFDGLTLYVVEA